MLTHIRYSTRTECSKKCILNSFFLVKKPSIFIDRSHKYDDLFLTQITLVFIYQYYSTDWLLHIFPYETIFYTKLYQIFIDDVMSV